MKTTIDQMLNVILMSFDGWLALWWVSLAVAVCFALAVGNLVRRRIKLGRASVALCILTLVSTIIFSAMAVLFEADHASPTAVPNTVVPIRMLGALGIAVALASIACVVLAKNQRLVATSIALFGGWLAFWVYFVAAMSVSGTWL